MTGSMTIIAPTDFSPAADRATRRAASLAATVEGQLHLVHVMPPRGILEEVLPPARLPRPSRQASDTSLAEKSEGLAA